MKQGLRQLMRYPAAAIGLAIIVILVVVAIYTVIAIPYNEAIRLWRGGGGLWAEYPKNAWPEWINLLPGENRPTTIILCSTEVGEKTVRPLAGGVSKVEILLPFDFTYDGFPQEISVFFAPQFDKRAPFAKITWLTPDGREIRVGERTAVGVYRMSIDGDLTRRLGGRAAHIGLFADPAAEGQPLKGRYTLRVKGWLMEENADLDARLVVFGQVHGLAGTDHLRRDLMVGLLWGIPVALVFGLLAAVGTQISTFILAAIGVWHRKWVDGAFRWLTQVNIIMPLLPILIMIGMFFSRSIGVMLGVIIFFNIFSASYFVLRAMFLQIKESSYIEAARAYGAGNSRIIFRYLIPKVIPVLLPQFILVVPGFVFLEASLAVLGLGDPHLPTLGKIIHEAHVNAAIFVGHYYWIVLPGVLLMVMGIAFAMVGYTLDRIINPRLRQI
ncbi:ABC transporter permease [Candidatus Acetothermia bacterium]|nr:ABC transporter permease [Candidatus Acetothermia bacterium]